MAASADRKDGKFGTFGGVFTPCTLTILGVIMFLRFGQVVGHSGVFYAIVIVLVSKLITTLTGLSLSAIATNTRVRGGGAYYLISRSLGVEFGGAIGVVFYLAQATSVAMYVIGFTEAFVDTFPSLAPQFRSVATTVNLLTFFCVYVGAGWTIKVQYGILAVLGVALVSFFVGAAEVFEVTTLTANLAPHYAEGKGLFVMFALFFPAVTGIMAGANMSGDLESPSRSIPRGTLAAIAVTGVVYVAMALALGGARTQDQLVSGNLVVKDVARWPIFITAGVFAATLSSALGSMMGAPRILQAFARDGVFRWLGFFGAGSGRLGEPRRAVVLTFVISEVCILLGDLDAIAPIITMFFMITYGLLNLATFYEAVTKNPSYRPTFRWCHWSLSLAGALGCLAVMFLINWLVALVSITVVFAIHAYIAWREIESRWGDLGSGVAFERARQALLRLEDEAYHPKNWRPVILALSGSTWSRPHLGVYGHWLTAGHGILSLAHVVTADVTDHAERREPLEAALRKFIKKSDLQAFPVVVIADSLAEGIESLVQCHGIGGLKPNTVLTGWPNNSERVEQGGATLRLLSRFGLSLIAARFLDVRDVSAGESSGGLDEADAWRVPEGPIDIWWRGMKNGALMLLLGHLIRRNPPWRRKEIRLLRFVETEAAVEDVRDHLRGLITASRIPARPVVVTGDDVFESIRKTSASAAVTILGFELPEEGSERVFYDRMEHLAGDLPRVLFVCSAGGMELES